MRHILLLPLFVTFTIGPIAARDNGQWDNVSPAVRGWFNGLRSDNGLCCSFADGVAVEDPDWRLTVKGTYQVFYLNEWRDVPPEAVVRGANHIGHAVVWPYPETAGGRIMLRCFLPGSES